MRNLPTVAATIAALSLCTGCHPGTATARLQLDNRSASPATLGFRPGGAPLLADGTSLRIKLIAAYIARDVDPVSQNNVGETSMIWLNPECGGDISGCTVEGLDWQAGPRVTRYFDFARGTAAVNADLNSQDQEVKAGTYRYARVEFCKSSSTSVPPAVPNVLWKGPGMAAEAPLATLDCGRTSLPFDPPLELGEGDTVEVTLGYDLAAAVVAGAPAPSGPSCAIAGQVDGRGNLRCFRSCVDVDASSRVCMDFPDFQPRAAKR